MRILAIRTDKPDSMIRLYQADKLITAHSWLAHSRLVQSLHLEIAKLLQFNNLDYQDLAGLIVFRGPGSFTGLRIGVSLANALAYGLTIPIVGANGRHWHRQGIERLLDGANDRQVVPEYGAPPHVTAPIK